VDQYFFDIFADYFQIYLADETAVELLFDSIDWSDQALSERVIAGEGFFAIAPARNMTVPLLLILASEAPDEKMSRQLFDEADHVVEGSLKLSSGNLLLWGLNDDEHKFSLSIGVYGVQFYFNNLDSLRENGLEGDDLYKIIIFPGSEEAPYRVTKRFV
jgi:hypothetical protein